jgi:hypothetical protein
MKDIVFMPDYPVRELKDITWCDHKEARFQGMYSLVGYYHCPNCKSKICPQEFQNRGEIR